MKTQILSKLHRQLIPNAGTLIVVALMLFAYTAWAAPSTPQATPGVISYQGTLTDSAGQPITDDVDMTFRLYDAPTDGSALWEEAHTAANAVPVQDGLFHVYLGSLTPISSTVWANSPLYVGVQVGSDAEMSPREALGAVPVAMYALTVPNGSITTEKIEDGAVTLAKLSSTGWVDLPLAAGFHSPPNQDWQKAQYRKIGDIVYLRGVITKDSGDIGDSNDVATLPTELRPLIRTAFVAEPHNFLTVKHRVDIHTDGKVQVRTSAGATSHVSLNGIFFSISP